VKPEARAIVEAWLQYFDDLKISAFYLDRNPASDATQTSVSSDAGPLAQAAAAAGTVSVAAMRAKLQASAPVVAATPLPVIKAASLFETSQRVEGDSLERISEDIGDCQRCRLCKGRNKIVFGSGSAHAQLVFVGEGPGRDEDIQGLPFVGRAGKLLTQMIEAMGLKRDEVYICNVVKCRPPENRAPEPDEMETCSPFLYRQLAVIQPKAVVCLGAIAFQALYGAKQSISRLRGQWLEFRGIPMMATYHPAYLLRNPNAKGEVWEDLKKVMAHLGLKVPSKS
jgi:uracil-DNA glycosylase